MPAVANIAPLAKLLGIPYAPIVPSPFPLPARVILKFGPAMNFAPVKTEDEVTRCVEQVKDEIRRLIDAGLAERTSVY